MYNNHQKLYKGIGGGSFSPLFIAVGSVTWFKHRHKHGHGNFQSAFHRGRECNLVIVAVIFSAVVFQSAFHRGRECNLTPLLVFEHG